MVFIYNAKWIDRFHQINKNETHGNGNGTTSGCKIGRL